MKAKNYIVLSLLALMASCGNKQSNTTVDPINVAIEEAGASASSESMSYVGEVEPESSTSVSSLAPGTVTKVLVQEGQSVGAGQTIAVMDPSQAQNALNSAKATLAQAQDAYNRMKALHDRKSISEIDWISVQTKYEQAKAAVEACQKTVRDCVITAPCAGVISQKNIESGMTVLPTQPICTIVSIGSIRVKITVPEKELNLFSPHTKTTINVKSINRTFHGGLVETGVEGNSFSRTYNVLIHMANPGQVLRPGMVCDVTVDGKPANSGVTTVISLPVTAVHHRANGDLFVWKAENDVARRAVVKVGVTYGDRIEILEGVAKGEKIITNGYQKLSDGSSIKING